MQNNIAQYLNSVPDSQSRKFLQILFNVIADRFSAQMLSPAAIVIFGAGSANAKTGANAVLALTNNGTTSSLVSVAAATVLTPFAGATLINTFNVYTFYVDGAGTVTAAMGTAAATLAGVVFPPTPQGKALIGGFTVNPTAGTFTGATTLLDAANTNVVYFSPSGALDPTILLGSTVVS